MNKFNLYNRIGQSTKNVRNVVNNIQNIKYTKKDELTNHFLSSLLKFTLPHLIIKRGDNLHFIVDRLNHRIHYAHLYYNLYQNETFIKQNNVFLMKQELILKKQFENYDIKCYNVGTGFYTKLHIPHNIKSLHHEGYHRLFGVNEYIDEVGGYVKFENSKEYKSCFANKTKHNFYDFV